MDEQRDAITHIVWLNGGQIAGKTRAQKIVYLLQRLLDAELYKFSYHHYGPYSIELATALDRAVEANLMSKAILPGYYSSPYAMFKLEKDPETVSFENEEKISKWLAKMEAADAVVLELAATWKFLEDECDLPPEKAKAELLELKSSKASNRRLEQADQLLSELELR